MSVGISLRKRRSCRQSSDLSKASWSTATRYVERIRPWSCCQSRATARPYYLAENSQSSCSSLRDDLCHAKTVLESDAAILGFLCRQSTRIWRRRPALRTSTDVRHHSKSVHVQCRRQARLHSVMENMTIERRQLETAVSILAAVYRVK